MNQDDLVQAIRGKHQLTQKEASALISGLFRAITQAAAKGDRIYIRGFGAFTKTQRAAKKVRHPQTGKIILIPSKTTLKFTPSKRLPLQTRKTGRRRK